MEHEKRLIRAHSLPVTSAEHRRPRGHTTGSINMHDQGSPLQLVTAEEGGGDANDDGTCLSNQYILVTVVKCS
eukprot:COSAG05_NODE_2336_length_3214_cov_2.012520_3_plen_73_part_00